MRKVEENINRELLQKFNDQILIPFFDFLLHLKQKDFHEIISLDTEASEFFSAEFPIALFRAKNGPYDMSGLIESLLVKVSIQELNAEREIFIKQNKQIALGQDVIYSKCIDELYHIFSKLFFEELFDSKECWHYVQKNLTYNRKAFYANFRTKNLWICPLCDIETIIEKSNSVVEHFYPRCDFPYLSMNPWNLISTCNACNKAEEGKGTKIFLPIALPYFIEVGAAVKFDVESNSGNQIIIKWPDVSSITNFEKTLKLNARYGKSDTAMAGISKLKSDIRIIEALKNIPCYSEEQAYTSYFSDKYQDNFYYFRASMLSVKYKTSNP